jgi:hypothetical protein
MLLPKKKFRNASNKKKYKAFEKSLPKETSYDFDKVDAQVRKLIL